jgi:hypothetical protein
MGGSVFPMFMRRSESGSLSLREAVIANPNGHYLKSYGRR